MVLKVYSHRTFATTWRVGAFLVGGEILSEQSAARTSKLNLNLLPVDIVHIHTYQYIFYVESLHTTTIHIKILLLHYIIPLRRLLYKKWRKK